ncbi:MAG: hypothetical protein WAX38_01665 [Minisyncoccia bacterium]
MQEQARHFIELRRRKLLEAEAREHPTQVFADALFSRLQSEVPSFAETKFVEGNTIVLHDNERMVGAHLTIRTFFEEKRVDIIYIRTHPELKKNPEDRTGSAVIDILKSEAKKAGCTTLCAKGALPEAVGFWVKAGFTKIPNGKAINPDYEYAL